MQKLISFQANYFKKRGRTGPNHREMWETVRFNLILNGEIRMDGPRFPFISTEHLTLPTFSCLNGPEFSVLHYMLLATQDPTVCFNPYGTQFGLIYVKHYFSVSLSTLKIPEILSWKSKKFLLKWQLEPSKKTLRHGLPVPGKNVLSQKLCDSKREKSIREEELELSESGAALRALPEFSVHEFCILGTRTPLTYCNMLVLLTQCNLWTLEIRYGGTKFPCGLEWKVVFLSRTTSKQQFRKKF